VAATTRFTGAPVAASKRKYSPLLRPFPTSSGPPVENTLGDAPKSKSADASWGSVDGENFQRRAPVRASTANTDSMKFSPAFFASSA
jgi:hypothetical protein